MKKLNPDAHGYSVLRHEYSDELPYFNTSNKYAFIESKVKYSSIFINVFKPVLWGHSYRVFRDIEEQRG